MSWLVFTDGQDKPFTDTDREDLARDTTGGPVMEGGSRDEASPEFNETVTDKKPLPGLPTRSVGGKSHPRRQHGLGITAPLAEINHNVQIDESISRVGHAASREAAGHQSHGTMQYDETIGPWIQDNRAFGNQYFMARPRSVQDTARNVLNPASGDPSFAAVAQNLGTTRSRKAYLNFITPLDLGSAVNGG